MHPDELLRHFDADTVERGQVYAGQGRVAHECWTPSGLVLTGICRDSEQRTYFVTASFVADGAERRLTLTTCTCPAGGACAHGAALLLAAAEPADESSENLRPATSFTDEWRNVLGAFVITDCDRVSAPQTPLGLLVELPEPSLYGTDAAPVLRLITHDKVGAWTPAGITWAGFQPTPTEGFAPMPGPNRTDSFPLEHVRAIRAIARADLDPSTLDAMSLGPSPADIWDLLSAASDAGVTLIPHDDFGVRDIKLITGSRMAFHVYHDSVDVVVEPYLQIDGNHTPTGPVGLIGFPLPHGLFAVCGTTLVLGPFDSPPSREALANLLAQGTIVIPDDDLDEFITDVLPELSASAPVDVDDDVLDVRSVSGPIPLLTIYADDNGSRVHWSISYRVNGRLREFVDYSDPDDTAYRDADEEEDCWYHYRYYLELVARVCKRWQQQALRYRFQGGVGTLFDDPDGDMEFDFDVERPGLFARIFTYDAVETAVLCAEVVPELYAAGLEVRIVGDPPEYVPAEDDPVIAISTHADDHESVANDWLNLSITVDVAGHAVPLSHVLRELAKGATHMLLPGGTYFRLDTPELTRLSELIREATELGEIERGKVRRRPSNSSLWDELLSLGVVDKQLAQWHSRIEQLASATAPAPVEPPPTLHADLRDYQRAGFSWLAFCWHNGIGGILADDMGLGKTVQILTLLAHAAADDPSARFLVVAPTSVVGNWISEAQRFVPTLDAVAITTTKATSGAGLAERIGDARLVVTSYTILRMQIAALGEFTWSAAIFDEAQFVKNHRAKTHTSARQLPATTKFAITGTPMENNLMELWALLSLTSPGLFPSPTSFTEYFRKPIEGGNSERLRLLRRRIRPVMLRRTKGQVADDLPPKQEQVVTLPLTPRHDRIYQTRLTRERQKVLGLLGDWEENRFAILRSLTMLRQLSLHAGLVDEAHLDVASTKIDYLAERLPELVAEGHSTLVFSQFTGFLHLIGERLTQIGLKYSYLDGSMPAPAREASINEFTGGTTQIFLISLKAGGFGLNLTEADYCFVCDPWWNPAAEAQAVDRAHRIGQTRPVTVYRLVSEATMEGKVIELQDRKRALFTAVMDEGAAFGGVLGAEDIRELFSDE